MLKDFLDQCTKPYVDDNNEPGAYMWYIVPEEIEAALLGYLFLITNQEIIGECRLPHGNINALILSTINGEPRKPSEPWCINKPYAISYLKATGEM